MGNVLTIDMHFSSMRLFCPDKFKRQFSNWNIKFFGVSWRDIVRRLSKGYLDQGKEDEYFKTINLQ